MACSKKLRHLRRLHQPRQIDATASPIKSPNMDTRLLELLVCPVTKGPLEYDRERQELTSRSARLAYPVRDDIPILLESEARVMTDEELGL
jgi:uncharacterized protein